MALVAQPFHKPIHLRRSVLLLCLLAACPYAVKAQAPGSTVEGASQIVVGEATASPGESLLVPLYFTPAADTPLRAVSLNIDYVSNNLKFQKAAAGPAAESSGAAVEATLSEGVQDEKGVTRSRLRVAVSLKETPAADGLPKGLLAYLLFQLSNDAKPFVIRLNSSVISAEGQGDARRNPAKVSVQSGAVTVEMGEMVPATACFFFSH